MERGTKLMLGGLAVVIALAFVTLGPGRTLYEPASAQDLSSERDDYAEEAAPGYEPDPVVTTIELSGNRTGYSDPDPLEDDGGGAAAVAPVERSVRAAARAADPQPARAPDRRLERGDQRNERAAAAASGLDDGDISTTGDLAF